MFSFESYSPVAWASFIRRGLGISKLQFLNKKNIIFFSALNFFQFLVIKTLDPELDPDPKLEKMLDPDPD
jgi:hypothetical protein